MWKGCEAIPRLSLGSNRGCRSRTNFLVRRASPTVKKPVVSLCVHTAISPRCRRLGHAFGSFVGESLQSFDQIEVSGVSRPGSSQRVGSPPTHLPERWRKATPPKLHKISVVEIWRRPPYAFHLLRLVRERGKSFSYYKHIVWRTTAPWRSRTTGTTSFQSRQFNPFLSG